MYDIYHPDHNNQWRYTLGTIGNHPLITVGLNPSTATQEKLDNTVTKVEKVARQCGFDSFIMLNGSVAQTLPPELLASGHE